MKLFKIILLISLFLPAFFVRAYESPTTHAGISEQSAEFYNYYFPRKLSFEEKELIIKGSIDEDYPEVRVLNHFYDPIRKIGIGGYRTAKDWATDEFTENPYIWPRAIQSYAEGNKEQAFLYLGHVVHLVQDMTVPDHTRNDPHIGEGVWGLFTGGSSFENWASKNKKRGTINGLADSYIKEGLKPIDFSELLQYFDFLSDYSNKNFFGDDSIANDVYQYENPKIVSKDKRFVYSFDSLLEKEFPVLNLRLDTNGKEELFLSDDEKIEVLSGYFDRLAKQAVLASAGVINLFIEEGEKARVLYEKEQARQQELETKKAIEIGQTLNSSNFLTQALYGFSFLVGDKLTTPVASAASAVSTGFVSGTQMAASGAGSAASFISFTTQVLAKEALNNTSALLSQAFSKLKSLASLNFNENLASPSAVTGVLEPVIDAPAPQIAKEQVVVTNEGRTFVVDNVGINTVSDINRSLADDLAAAYSILAQLSADIKAKEAPTASETRFIQAYSPGFGGGGELSTPLSPVIEEKSSPEVDKPVDNVGTTTESAENDDDTATSTLSYSLGTTTASFETGTTTESGTASTTESAEDESAPKDTTPPDIFVDIPACVHSLSSSGCLLATTSLSVFWGSNATDTSFFEISMNGELSTTTDTSSTYSLSNDSKNIFSVVSIDAAGNRSAKEEKTVKIYLLPVVINEIAWNGTDKHSEDEWLELYNRTDEDIDLSDWVLYSKTDKSPYINLSGTILAKDYFLIERKNDGEGDEATQSPVKDIPADMWVSFGMGLSNSGENLILSLASTTIDEVPYFLNWRVGSVDKTAERISAEISGEFSNWWTNFYEITNGKNVAGAKIYGTPKKRNSASILLSPKTNTIASDISLKRANSPYFIPSNSTITLSEGAKMTIEPGVVVKFNDGGTLSADGNIIANGTAEEPVVFTSFYDDEFGGDLNGDGICDPSGATSTVRCPIAGGWRGLWLSSKSAGSSFSHAKFRYGGMTAPTRNGILDIAGASPNITESSFEYSSSNGLCLKDSNSRVSGGLFSSNKLNGLYVERGAPNVNNSTFKNNQVGFYSTGSDTTVVDNSFADNIGKGIYLANKIGGQISGNSSSKSDSTASGDLIYLNGNITVSDGITTLSKNQMPYFIYGNVGVVASSTLSIGAGSKILSSNAGTPSSFIVNGRLEINGTTDEPVTFSALENGAAPGSWAGITMNPGSSSSIKGAVFRDAATALTYKYMGSSINLSGTAFYNNNLALMASGATIIDTVLDVIFGSDNKATTSPGGLW